MDLSIRIVCPSVSLSKDERIDMIINHEFKKWLFSEELTSLVRRFNHDILPPIELSVVEYITWLKDFAEKNWNYRQMQISSLTKGGEKARWLLKDDDFTKNNKELIYRVSKKLGLIGLTDTYIINPDYILPLGGAKMSNLRRCELAHDIIEKYKYYNTKVVALSAYRPILETERIYIDLYALNAKFEFDAIVEGLKSAFAISEKNELISRRYDNPNRNYAIYEFKTKADKNQLFAVAAPSKDPDVRRANSADCLEFFFEKFNIPSGSRIINCTSQIYCPYQQVRALTFAIEYNVVFDTVGFPFCLNRENDSFSKEQLSNPVNYLQEIKATIDAMFDFVKIYS